MPYSEYLKRRTIVHRDRGLSALAITDALAEEGLRTTRQGIGKFLKRYARTHSFARAPGSGRPTKISPAVLEIIEAQMCKDDETTAFQLHGILCEYGQHVSLSTVFNSRRLLGWTFRSSSYCQLIRDVNKVKWLEWARQYATEAEAGFNDVIYSNETSIQLETHQCFCCRKQRANLRETSQGKGFFPLKLILLEREYRIAGFFR